MQRLRLRLIAPAGAATGEADVEAGMLLLDPAAVQAALLPRPLSLLVPSALSVAFDAAVPSPGQPHARQCSGP